MELRRRSVLGWLRAKEEELVLNARGKESRGASFEEKNRPITVPKTIRTVPVNYVYVGVSVIDGDVMRKGDREGGRVGEREGEQERGHLWCCQPPRQRGWLPSTYKGRINREGWVVV